MARPFRLIWSLRCVSPVNSTPIKGEIRLDVCYAFFALTAADGAVDVKCSARASAAADRVGMVICMRRSFFGSRQFTCGSMSDASTRSRYFIAMFISDRVDASLKDDAAASRDR